MFSDLTQTEAIYFYIALFGTVLFIVQSVFTFLDFGDTFDMDSDFDGQVDMDASQGLGLPFNIITVRGIIGFIMLFGWAGFLFSKSGVTKTWALLLALLSGIIMMFVIALVYHYVSKLTESGNVDINLAIGKEAEVYLPIPGNQTGSGKVTVLLNDSLREMDAITNDDGIKSGEPVKVVGIINNKLVVEKIKK